MMNGNPLKPVVKVTMSNKTLASPNFCQCVAVKYAVPGSGGGSRLLQGHHRGVKKLSSALH
jgi:hypothetical protein